MKVLQGITEALASVELVESSGAFVALVFVVALLEKGCVMVVRTIPECTPESSFWFMPRTRTWPLQTSPFTINTDESAGMANAEGAGTAATDD